jgi:hypothetical protein
MFAKQCLFDYSTYGLDLQAGSNAVLCECNGVNNAAGGAFVHEHSSVLQYKMGGEGDNAISGNSGTVEITENGVSQIGTWAGIDIITPDCIKRNLQTYFGPLW